MDSLTDSLRYTTHRIFFAIACSISTVDTFKPSIILLGFRRNVSFFRPVVFTFAFEIALRLLLLSTLHARLSDEDFDHWSRGFSLRGRI